MTDSAKGAIDAQGLEDQIASDQAWLAEEDKIQGTIEEEQAARDAKAAQYQAEQQDPRNKEQWGVGGVVKELQSAFAGGIQDTASSIATLPERAIDLATGEMTQEAKTEEGYKPEWDDFFVDDANPIETRTWWGGLIRSTTHFGTLGGAIVAAAPVVGVEATAV